ncbi:hypothetical protein KY290_025961 [Solanum tuberosum]|uniref:Uncharacterized protein n=1 Tax=Solanum tuberosum TaxID=4113 RepID=A0ABQ7UX36_SOLTU|nr:hypothetical protein KY289_025040 [Solanum tuberosum]KAH0673729.1 hypothetical protein KY284_024816 [Solanum tuberosum]KAH0677872.1 hypothetical protein KY285_025673 [Solanum tuberosum]KAH0755691.1 hypothetical protein KY290_025961 [Solanum tuberosum]
MAPLDSGPVVFPTEITDPTYNGKQAVEGNIEKTSYATKVLTIATPATTNFKHPRELVIAKHATHNGVPTVIFKSKDYYGVMAEECKLTIVRRFLKPHFQIEKIRSVFKELFPIKGSAKIDVYDTINVFIDFTNEDDFYKAWFRSVIEIEGVLERIKANEAKEIERNAINLDDNGKQNTEELESSNIKEKNAENIKIIE